MTGIEGNKGKDWTIYAHIFFPYEIDLEKQF